MTDHGDIPPFIAELLLEQERDKRERERRVEVVVPLPDPTAKDEEE